VTRVVAFAIRAERKIPKPVRQHRQIRGLRLWSSQGGYGAFHIPGTQADFDRIVVDGLNAS
jgi:hypothetical protein